MTLNEGIAMFRNVAISITVLCFVSIAYGQQTTKAQKDSTDRQMIVQVLDESGQPIPKSVLMVYTTGKRQTLEVGPDGNVAVNLPAKDPTLFSMRARAPRHVWMRATWLNRDSKKDPLPTKFSFKLPKGTVVGGSIVNQEGKPIEGAKVSLSVSGPKVEGQRAEQSIYGLTVKTDAKGNWSTATIPEKLVGISLRVEHDDFVSDSSIQPVAQSDFPKLRDKTFSRVMQRGITITGVVTDADGKPIEGAVLVLGHSPFGSKIQKPKTDKNGRYRFTGIKPSQMELTVVAKGFSPNLQRIDVGSNVSPVNIQLKSGSTLRVRVVDKAGKPIAKVRVIPDSWRGARSLLGLYDKVIPVHTNDDGRLVWDWAPADEIQFDILKQGYMATRNHAMTAGEDEYVLTMNPVLRVTGRVLDSKTKKPIDAFRMTPGTRSNPDRIYWERHNQEKGGGGKYALTINEPSRGERLVRVEVDGYKPTVSRVFQDDEGNVEFDFEMVAGEGPSGQVFTSKGKPIADAKVILCTPGNGPYFRNGATFYGSDVTQVTTDAQGFFRFGYTDAKFTILVVADEGYARVDKEQFKESAEIGSAEIKVQAWAQIEGTLLKRAMPWGNQEIVLNFNHRTESGQPQMYFDYKAKTDKDGRYVMSRVPPGMEGTISRVVQKWNRGSISSSSHSHSLPIATAAGDNQKITIGGTGRPVTGRLVMPEGDDRKLDDWNFGFAYFALNLPAVPGLARPHRPQYAFHIERDGSFRVEDVPEGDYEFSVKIYEPTIRNGHWQNGDYVGGHDRQFTIEAIPEGRSDKPFELGELELAPRR